MWILQPMNEKVAGALNKLSYCHALIVSNLSISFVGPIYWIPKHHFFLCKSFGGFKCSF